uniref:PDZ domain-containing protein n=1 Tax=Haplochromis burtoni TaxID=8153 RepID=A0A3Q2WZB1_HAPBU
MFWKNAAWSWDDAAGDDDDDGGYLLAADLRRTPDSTPDSDLNHIVDAASSTGASTASLTKSTSTSATSTSGPKDLISSLHSEVTSYSSHASTLYTNTSQQYAGRDGSAMQRMEVSIARGKDGFGFTICSDCPVRVQAVDPGEKDNSTTAVRHPVHSQVINTWLSSLLIGGPAHQSGLRQGDSVLQLNGLPVETWKCVDLAHAIRSCQSQIVLVVWRSLPEVRSACDAMLRPHTHSATTGRKLLSNPTQSKQDRKWGQGSGVRASLGALGSLWRDRKEDREEEEEEEDQEMYTPHTTTLKGTRVTSSNGDNYIILSPVNPEGQDICTRLAPEVRTSSTTRVWGRYRDLLPGKSPPCLHLFPPHLWPRPETMATTRTAPLFSHMCPAQDMEPTSPWRPKPSSSLFSSSLSISAVQTERC